MSSTYDFVVVGAGPAGIMAATRLASSRRQPSVLLIEAGGKNDMFSWRVDGERWVTRFNPGANWGYETVPQKALGGRAIEYDRGKGLGGSSAVNFSVWTVGAADDYNEVARMVGDDDWRWENAKGRFQRIADYADDDHIPEEYRSYVSPKIEDHGHNGPIKVGFPVVWEESLKDSLDTWLSAGFTKNLDCNSGNPLGISVLVNSACKGIRSTASDALKKVPDNLTVITNSQVARVLFSGTAARGVETLDGRSFFATKEVILSAGSLDTPRILMHSGLGPKDQLEKFGLKVLQDHPHVGQHLMDHHHVFYTYTRAEHTSKRQVFFRSKEAQAMARAQWEKDQTGPLSEIATSMSIGFLKLDEVLNSAEFAALPRDTQTYLQKPTVPSYEFLGNGPVLRHLLDPDNAVAMSSICAFILNGQSRGTITLQSSDPATPLLFDPQSLSHPYDRKVAVEMGRDLFRYAESPAFKKDTLVAFDAPKSDSAEDILDFFEKNASSTWHMTGTARMSKHKEGGVVDTSFRVYGVENLRLADMSISPVLPNAHTQAPAYHIGLLLGDKLVTEYGLDE